MTKQLPTYKTICGMILYAYIVEQGTLIPRNVRYPTYWEIVKGAVLYG